MSTNRDKYDTSTGGGRILIALFMAAISVFVARSAMASDECGLKADLALKKIYGLPDDIESNVCRHYGVLLMKSMLTDVGPFSSEAKQGRYERKARMTSKRAIKKCTKKRIALVRECKAADKPPPD